MSDLNKVDTNLSETKTDTDTNKIQNNEIKYAVLMETNGEECESWYYSIRYNGNEENLKYLNEQLETIDWYILDDFSTFDLDLEHLISEETAKQLTKLELNHYSFHRKFDGVLDKIDLKLKKNHRNEKKISRVFDILGYGKIEDFVDKEDIDEEDLTDKSESSSDNDSQSDKSESEEHTDKNPKSNKKNTIPPSIRKTEIPRIALVKQRKNKK
jgi:hypothetical protein